MTIKKIPSDSPNKTILFVVILLSSSSMFLHSSVIHLSFIPSFFSFHTCGYLLRASHWRHSNARDSALMELRRSVVGAQTETHSECMHEQARQMMPWRKIQQSEGTVGASLEGDTEWKKWQDTHDKDGETGNALQAPPLPGQLFPTFFPPQGGRALRSQTARISLPRLPHCLTE